MKYKQYVYQINNLLTIQMSANQIHELATVVKENLNNKTELQEIQRSLIFQLNRLNHPQYYLLQTVGSIHRIGTLIPEAYKWYVEMLDGLSMNSSFVLEPDNSWLLSHHLNSIPILAKHIKIIRTGTDGCAKGFQLDLGNTLCESKHPHGQVFSEMAATWTVEDLPPESDKWFNDMIDGLSGSADFSLDPPAEWFTWETN
jgi:hypothetical protein